MLRNRNIDRICCIVLAATLLLTCAFMGAAASGLVESESSMGYENRLFDQERVHTIDIVMDDWEGFLETCTNEEYASCTVVIDGEAFGSVAIRAKGNTSLSSVSSYGNDRYSFKIEFDHYENGKTYYGLDKLSLNNLIQDSTLMKDYLAYTLMGKMGVAAPLCSFVQVNVNGEAWGLYLAVEAVEDSFLTRNYGSDHGELYKPDNLSMGGGRGNGRDFDVSVFEDMFSSDESESDKSETDSAASDRQSMRGQKGMNRGGAQQGDSAAASGGSDFSQMPGGFDPTQLMGGNFSFGRMTDGIFSEDFDWTTLFGADFDISSLMSGEFSLSDYVDEDFDVSQIFSEEFDPTEYFGEDFEYSDMLKENFDWTPLFEAIGKQAVSSMKSFAGMGGGGGFGGMGSSDVMLQYVDDDPSSYSSIFESAKTDITEDDQERLIEALRKLSEGETLDEKLTAVDAEAVIRYLVVHHFTDNGDSYTGSMIHNYYLYEEDGALSMIPWDYNLAFGAFGMGGGGFGGSSGATSSVNSPIDTPVSSGDISTRPILAWIFESEEYTALYHEIYQEFADMCYADSWLDAEIERVSNLIAPYVEADENGFCTYEEFVQAIETLREYCALRGESIIGQLDGSIPSTEEGQNADSGALVDASHIDLSDMGSMNMGGGKGGNRGGFTMPDGLGGGAQTTPPDMPTGEGGMTLPENFDPSTMNGMQQPTGDGNMTPPEGFDPSTMTNMQQPTGDGNMTPPEGFDPSTMTNGMQQPTGDGSMTPPEGFDPSTMTNMQMPTGEGSMTPPENTDGMQQPADDAVTPPTGNAEAPAQDDSTAEQPADTQPEPQESEAPAGETPDSAEGTEKNSMSRGGFSGDMPDITSRMGSGSSSSDSCAWLMLAISAAVLLAGLFIAGLHKSGR